MKEKILLDTDIGTDIDDAVCLAYLLCQEKCDLLGITTVSGESVIRAKIASALCKVAGRDDIPIFPGTENPLHPPQKQPEAHQAKYLPRRPHKTDFPKGMAIEFMRRTIRENPGEVTLLAIGPMTNIALLFAVDEEIPSLLKNLVLMCGNFTYHIKGQPHLTEWNARCDPYATAYVYNSPAKNIVSLGLDVTTKIKLDKDETVKRFNSDILKAVIDFSGFDDNTRKDITFHDPLAAAVIFKKDICGFKRGNVEVETGISRFGAITCWTHDENGKNEVAFTINEEMFFQHFFEVTNV